MLTDEGTFPAFARFRNSAHMATAATQFVAVPINDIHTAVPKSAAGFPGRPGMAAYARRLDKRGAPAAQAAGCRARQHQAFKKNLQIGERLPIAGKGMAKRRHGRTLKIGGRFNQALLEVREAAPPNRAQIRAEIPTAAALAGKRMASIATERKKPFDAFREPLHPLPIARHMATGATRLHMRRCLQRVCGIGTRRGMSYRRYKRPTGPAVAGAAADLIRRVPGQRNGMRSKRERIRHASRRLIFYPAVTGGAAINVAGARLDLNQTVFVVDHIRRQRAIAFLILAPGLRKTADRHYGTDRRDA